MKMTLSTPRTISSSVSVTRAMSDSVMVDGSCQGERVILSLLRLAGLEAGAFDDRQARISRVAGVAIGHPAPDELAPAVIDHARGVPASAAQARRRRRLPGRRDMVHHGGMFTSEATT